MNVFQKRGDEWGLVVVAPKQNLARVKETLTTLGEHHAHFALHGQHITPFVLPALSVPISNAKLTLADLGNLDLPKCDKVQTSTAGSDPTDVEKAFAFGREGAAVYGL
ncbi:hypothetical protein GF342_00725, partial [Candidatus Woesearchaeota archaeon]|nr:hypothetical protein [Candidatus Woesearchaeota archaeon]